MAAPPPTFLDETGAHRCKDIEYVLPIIVGTIAWPMGKKATDSMSHRWTVYLRGVNNEDLSHVITRVQFDLHPTFATPVRVVETQPFEVTEHGWGEFDIVVHVNFALDSGESEAVIYHRLRLYDDGEAVGSRQEPKKPIVFETYEELVFSEPRLEFYQRMQAHVPRPLDPQNPQAAWFKPPSQQTDLDTIRALRARVAAEIAGLRRDAAMAAGVGVLPGMPMPGVPGMHPGLPGLPAGGPGFMLPGGPGLPGVS